MASVSLLGRLPLERAQIIGKLVQLFILECYGAITVRANGRDRGSPLEVTRTVDHISNVMAAPVKKRLPRLRLSGFALDGAVRGHLKADLDRAKHSRRRFGHNVERH